MKYFLHDSNAFNDEKITQLFIKFGYEGVGLFYTILEKLAQQEKPILTDVLKHQLKVGKKLEKIWKFIEEIELISSNNGETFNEQLLNFSKKYQIKKEKNAKRISEWRKNHKDTKNVTRYESVSNTPKVKLSKVKLSKDIEERESDFKNKILSYKNEYNIDLLNNFFNYWSQHGDNDKKMLFEKQKSFEIKKRLQTWKKNESKFKGQKEGFQNNQGSYTGSKKAILPSGDIETEW